MTSCITQSLLELKLVNGSGEVSAGRTRGNVMRRKSQVTNVHNPSNFPDAMQVSALFYKLACVHVDYKCMCLDSSVNFDLMKE